MTVPQPGQPALVLPLGQFFGTFYTDLGTTDRVHNVRLGSELRELDDRRFAFWSMLHGVPDQVAERSWTRQAVRDAVAALESEAQPAGGALLAEDPDRVIDSLVSDGLAVEIQPAGPQAVRFADGHRIRPRMLGLGNHQDEPWSFAIGFFDQPIVTVTRTIYNLWEWAETYPSLWAACQSLARQERAAGVTDPDLADPDRMLAGFLGMVHRLLAVCVCYVEPVQ